MFVNVLTSVHRAICMYIGAGYRSMYSVLHIYVSTIMYILFILYNWLYFA